MISGLLETLARYLWIIAPIAGMALLAIVRMAGKQLGLDLTSAVMWLFRRKVRKSILGAVNLRRYCKLVLAGSKTEFLHVPGADKSMALRTDELFVKLRFDADANTSTTYTNDNILDAGSRIVVVGDPGSGKSSLVKRVFRDLCRAAITGPRGARIPIVVELKDLPKKRGQDWLLGYIRNQVAEVEGHKMADFFDLYARQNGIVLLLDGLDEVASSECEAVVDEINHLSRALAKMGDKNSIVLTMRVQFHRQIHRALEEDFPLALQVKPFRPEDVYEFLSRWFKGPVGMRNASRLHGELADRPSLREMCTNPLILAMYAASHRDVSDADLPDTRAEFYRSVVDELLVRRRSRQLGDRQGRIAKRNDRYTILGKMAVDNLLDFDQPANSVRKSSAVAAVKQVLKIKSDEAAEDMLDELAKDTGIFDEERSGESIRFIHLTFCEYLAAAELIEHRQGGWKELIARHAEALSGESYSKARLVEVIPFAVARMHSKDQGDALTDVYRLGQPDLYARCLIETQKYDHENWGDYVAAERAWLLDRPYEQWDAYWLSRLQIYQTALAESSQSVRDDGSTVRVDKLFLDLISDQRKRLMPLFSAYAAESPRGAFRLSGAVGVDLVAEAPDLIIEECANPPFLATCLDVAGSAQADANRWARIFVAAGFRSALVARTLNEQEVPAAWLDADDASVRRENWDPVAGLPNQTRPSLYSFSISVVRSQLHGGDLATMPPLLLPLGLPKPPRFLIRGWSILVLGLLLIGALWLIARSVGISTTSSGHPFQSAALAVGLWAGFALILGASRRYRAYRSLVHLDSLGETMFSPNTFSMLTHGALFVISPGLVRALRLRYGRERRVRRRRVRPGRRP